MINSLLKKNWQKLLIQGRHNSGKSDLSFLVLSELLNQDPSAKWMSRLIDEREKILLFTEKADQVQLINKNLFDKISIVENISSKNYFEYLVKYHEWSNVELLIIDYINLLNDRSHLMKDLLKFVTENNIKTIFVENTYKLLKVDLQVQDQSDYIIQTERGNHGLEILLKKEDGVNLVYPKSFWLPDKSED